MFNNSDSPLTPEQQSRLEQLLAGWKSFAGRAPGGSGQTGLASNDLTGYSQMLNEQTEGMNLMNLRDGKNPVSIRQGRNLGGMAPSLADDPSWQQSQDMFTTTHDPMIAALRKTHNSARF